MAEKKHAKKKKSATKKTRSLKKSGTSADIDILKKSEELLKILKAKEIEIFHTEDALVEAMKRFRDLYEQSPIGVSIHDTLGNILVINAAFQKTLGIRAFRDISSYNFFTDKHLSSINVEALRSGKTVQMEASFDFKKVSFETGREGAGCFFITVSPIFRGDDVAGYMLLLQDITERKKIEEAQRLAQLGRLISDMAHEVNNPLMIISGKAEIALMQGVKDEKLKDTLQTILDQCFTAKDIIQRVLKYSRLGKMKKDSVDIKVIFDMILDLLSHYLKLSNVKVKKTIKGHIPFVMGNEKQLQEVFINILRNSADAMPKGGAISVRISRIRKYVRVDISDNGEGMPRKVLERIFEPFFTTKDNGTGLGLAVCHTIIQEHDGELKFESKEGKGTKATIHLPYVAEGMMGADQPV